MAETLGMLCDKLTIVKLKEFHSQDPEKLKSLHRQSVLLQNEINEFIHSAVKGEIPIERLSFASHKVYKKEGNEVSEVSGNFGEIFYKLADVNCSLWHEQEKVYEFETVPAKEKDQVVKKLALLNLERNNCIDSINQKFAELIISNSTKI